MKYVLEDIAIALKNARQVKGLSQRSLSGQTGLTQANISKIEGGGVDVKISSLIELARALDLEITLIPRKAMPAVQNLARISKPQRSQKEIHGAITSIKTVGTLLSSLWPENHGLRRLRELAPEFESLQINSEEVEKLVNIKEQLNQIFRSAKSEKNSDENAAKANGRKINILAKQIRQMRNEISHRALSDSQETPRPAYFLDEGDNHG